MSDIIICGTGAECEETCPVMRMNRICPPVSEMLIEMRDINHAWVPERHPALRA